MPGSPPPGMMYAMPAYQHHPAGFSPPGGASPPLQHDELMQRMAGLGLGMPVPSSVRSEGRASARIARSHRAGGAYNAQDFVFDEAEAESGQGRTTLMVRNIPNKYSQDQMVSILKNVGFEGMYDFLYLPVDFRNKCNLGYAFINMCTSPATSRLHRAFHMRRWDEQSSRKICEVTFARVQGRDALIEHFRAAKFPNVEDSDLQPMVFTQREGEVASVPVSITHYIRMLEEHDEVTGEASVASASAAEIAAAEPEAQQCERGDAPASAVAAMEQQ